MKQVRRMLGYVWMLMGPAASILLIWQAIDKTKLAFAQQHLVVGAAAKEAASSAAINTMLQWGIIILVFLPIAAGMVLFGRYAVDGEYDHIPTTSQQLH